MMDTVQTLINALVVAFAATVLGWMVGGFRCETREATVELRGEIATLRSEVRQEFGALRTEFREEITTLRTEVREELRAVRSDLTQVALAVVRPRAENE